jgi:hypothetical protein
MSTYSVSICSVFAIVLFGSGSIDFVDKFIITVVESAFSCSSMTTVGDVFISRRIKADFTTQLLPKTVACNLLTT